MRFLAFFLLAGFAMASATYIQNFQDGRNADKEFLVKQKKIINLLNHVLHPTTYDDQIKIAKEFSIEANVDKYLKVEAVRDFLDILRRGIVPKVKIFTLTFDKHRDEAIALFNLFFYAKDFETFYRTACWAREHMNRGMFVYSLTVAVLHRPDCKGIVLPAPYEIYPFYFVTADVINAANRIKTQGGVFDRKLAEKNGVYTVGNNVYSIYTNHSVNYDFMDEEQKISYFTNDIGLNTYYYYFHIDYPFWMGGQDFGLLKDRRGELHYYVHQQLLARYYLERLSNGLGEIDRFSWRWPIRKGFNPNVVFPTGYAMPARTDDYNLESEYNVYLLEEVETYERRIRNAIDRGFITLYDGTKVMLREPRDIDTLGKFIQGNPDLGDIRFYDHLTVIAKFLLGAGINTYNEENYVPSAIEQFETCMRDPMFYVLYQRIVRYYLRFKEYLGPYIKNDLKFTGVKVEDVKFTKLVTFFEKFEFDITNGVTLNKDELTARKENLNFLARQRRLNHKSFEVNIDVSSDKETDASVRIFLGPKYDSMGRFIKFDENRLNFVELDYFMTKLKAGKNILVRKNIDFARTVVDKTPMFILNDKIENALKGSGEFRLDMTEAHNGWPLRLLLPKGKFGGMTFQVFVIVTPFRQSKITYGTTFPKQYVAGVGSGSRFYEDVAFGYPLDRPVDESEFWCQNMYLGDVMIFHSRDEIKDNKISFDDKDVKYNRLVKDDRTFDRDFDRTFDRTLDHDVDTDYTFTKDKETFWRDN